jgi:hypothetical protein
MEEITRSPVFLVDLSSIPGSCAFSGTSLGSPSDDYNKSGQLVETDESDETFPQPASHLLSDIEPSAVTAVKLTVSLHVSRAFKWFTAPDTSDSFMASRSFTAVKAQHRSLSHSRTPFRGQLHFQ